MLLNLARRQCLVFWEKDMSEHKGPYSSLEVKTGNVAQWVECLPSMHGALGSVPASSSTECGGAHLSLQAWEVDLEGLEV